MPHFKAGHGADGDESSDSDHRDKRRKTGHMRPSEMNGTPKLEAGASPAAPNSFAAKMMAKMGYVEGQGLGATGKGRLAPIETQQRPQGAGLGAVKEKTKQAKAEEKREAAFRGEKVEDSSEEERSRRRKLKEKRTAGVYNTAGTPRTKPKFRTATEMEAAAEGLEVPNVLKSIIDATGQETKLLASTTGLMSSGVAMVPSETEPMKIARRARRDLEAFMEEWRSMKEREEYYEAEQTQLLLEVERGKEEFRVATDMITAVEGLQRIDLSNPGSGVDAQKWEEVTAKLEGLDRSLNYDKDYSGPEELAVAAISPLFRNAMEAWEPLNGSKTVVQYLQRLQHIIGSHTQTTSSEVALQDGVSYRKPPSKSTTPYETMLHKYWLPRIRSAITNDWDVYSPDPLIDLIKSWESVLPTFLLANVIDQLVVRRLTDAIATWKPRGSHKYRRHTQPQSWLFPWLEYLDEQHTNPKCSSGLLADARRKLKTILSSWNLHHGVLPGFDDWTKVFHSDIASMLVRHLLPRLASFLSEHLEVDPSDQNLTPLEKVLEWKPYFTPRTMQQLMSQEFFPKWHATLYQWLTSTSANFDEISQWFQWWKETLETLTHDNRRLTEFNELPEVAADWNKGVESINRAIDAIEDGVDVGEQLEAPTVATAAPLTSPTPIAAVLIPKPLVTDAPITFKDVVEDWCAENDLHMIALREADLLHGLPLFRITASVSGRGGIVVYLKGDVIWVRSTDKLVFTPAGLDEALVARAEGK